MRRVTCWSETQVLQPSRNEILSAEPCLCASYCAFPVNSGHTNLSQKGVLYRLGAWFSIIPAIKQRDQAWTYTKLFLRWLCRALMAPTDSAKKAREEALSEVAKAAAQDGAGGPMDKSKHQQQMKELRKAAGNSLVLAGLLYHNLNWWNCRVLYLCGNMLYKEQAAKAMSKKTALHDQQHCIGLAGQSGVQLLKLLWQEAVGDAQELARIGIAATESCPAQSFAPEEDPDTGDLSPGILPQAIPEKFMGFLLNLVEARLWTQAAHFETLPAAFAALLHPEPKVQEEAAGRLAE